jgi:hypothetical protein
MDYFKWYKNNDIFFIKFPIGDKNWTLALYESGTNFSFSWMTTILPVLGQKPIEDPVTLNKIHQLFHHYIKKGYDVFLRIFGTIFNDMEN